MLLEELGELIACLTGSQPIALCPDLWNNRATPAEDGGSREMVHVRSVRKLHFSSVRMRNFDVSHIFRPSEFCFFFFFFLISGEISSDARQPLEPKGPSEPQAADRDRPVDG